MGNWIKQNPDQAISFIILVVGVCLMFATLSFFKRIQPTVAVRRARRRREPTLGPQPVMWDVRCGPTGAGTWGAYQPLNVQARGRDPPLPAGPGSAFARSTDADVTVLIAMPVPPESRSSIEKSALYDEKWTLEDDEQPMPYVALATTITRTPSHAVTSTSAATAMWGQPLSS